MGGLSERERSRVIARLQGDYASGALSTQTLERRLDSALRAATRKALRRVTHDLDSVTLLDRLRAGIGRLSVAVPPSGALISLARDRPVVIGRARSCDIVLTNDSVSRRHAMLAREGERYFLTDLRSTNGTRLSGRYVRHVEVVPGDDVEFGEVRMIL